MLAQNRNRPGARGVTPRCAAMAGRPPGDGRHAQLTGARERDVEGMNDIWVCATCKSINRQRDQVCYKCRARQDQSSMETDAASMRVENAVINRAARDYLPSWPIAVLAGVLLVAVAVLGVVLLLRQLAEYPTLKAAFQTALESTSGGARLSDALAASSVANAGLVLLRGGLIVGALVTFAAWLAVATMNVPALGGGYPSRGPIRVFIYTLIPIWNLFKVPGMVQDVMYRVDPKAGGAMMVLAAALGLLGSWFVSTIGTWIITAAGVGSLFKAASFGDAVLIFSGILDQLFGLAVITELMIAGGTILLVVIMGRVEARCAARNREIRAAVAAG
jgi:hypothetical protein